MSLYNPKPTTTTNCFSSDPVQKTLKKKEEETDMSLIRDSNKHQTLEWKFSQQKSQQQI
jgi:hypothetical protein